MGQGRVGRFAAVGLRAGDVKYAVASTITIKQYPVPDSPAHVDDPMTAQGASQHSGNATAEASTDCTVQATASGLRPRLDSTLLTARRQNTHRKRVRTEASLSGRA
eukprot:3187610-Prymnesium_polylepis.1